MLTDNTPPGITDDMIEAAARASFGRLKSHNYADVSFDELPEEHREGWLLSARVGLEAALAGRTEPEPDWSALRDACDEYCGAYMHDDDSLMPAALDKVRRALAGEDPYNPRLAVESSKGGDPSHA